MLGPFSRHDHTKLVVFGLSHPISYLARRYLHLDEGTLYRVTGLAHLEDPECYAGGSIGTVRASLAGHDEGERSDEERHPVPPGWGLRRWTSTPTLGKMPSSQKPYTKALESDWISTETTPAV